MGLILVSFLVQTLITHPVFSFVFMEIAQMLSIYHRTIYHFLNICRNIELIVIFVSYC